MDLFLFVTVFLSAIALVSSRPKEKMNEEFAMGTNDMDVELNRMDDKAISMAREAVEMDEEANKIEEEANEMDGEANEMDEEANEMDEEAITMKEMDDAANKTVQSEDSSRQAGAFADYVKDQVETGIDVAIDEGAEKLKNSWVGEYVGDQLIDKGKYFLKKATSSFFGNLARRGWNNFKSWGRDRWNKFKSWGLGVLGDRSDRLA